MPSLQPRYNWGTEVKNINSTLYNQLNDQYTTIARIVNTKASRNVTTVNPSANSAENAVFDLGDLWINTSSDTAWIMTSRTSSSQVTWSQIT